MNRGRYCLSGFLLLSFAAVGLAQMPDASPAPQGQTQNAPPEGSRGPGRRSSMEGRGTIGKITAVHGDSLTVTRPDGTNVTVKFMDKTEFRKDRQPAKLADFKVGDFVMVRGEEDTSHTITAQTVSGRSANGGPGGPAGAGGGALFGEMGKDFVAGEVKSIDAPKLTVLRPDNVTETVELTEDTSLHRGRESITLADIEPGDHVVVHGSLVREWRLCSQERDGSFSRAVGAHRAICQRRRRYRSKRAFGLSFEQAATAIVDQGVLCLS